MQQQQQQHSFPASFLAEASHEEREVVEAEEGQVPPGVAGELGAGDRACFLLVKCTACMMVPSWSFSSLHHFSVLQFCIIVWFAAPRLTCRRSYESVATAAY